MKKKSMESREIDVHEKILGRSAHIGYSLFVAHKSMGFFKTFLQNYFTFNFF